MRRTPWRPCLEGLESRLFLTASELIRNGSFEGPAVSDNWVCSGLFQADSRYPNPHSGLGYSYLSNTDGSMGNSINGSMYQQVTIPANPTALTLTFWTYINTQETTTTTQYDLLTVKVMDSTGANQLAFIGMLGNLDKSSSYVQRTYTLPMSLAGQTVRLLFSASTDASKPTTFRVDDVGFSYAPPPSTQRVVGYLPGTTGLSQMDLGLLTWVNYFASSVAADGSFSQPSSSSVATVVNAAHAKGVGVSLSFTQPNDTVLPSLAGDATARGNFANNCLAYLQAHSLDGVDIDWEPPAKGVNQANYALLIDSLYAVLHPYGYAITTASNPITHEVPVAATNEMDWVNVMCYDFGYADVSPYAITISSMNGWASYGVDKRKLVMGVPFYGRYGTSWNDTHAKSYGETTIFGATSHILSDYKSIYGVYPAFNVDSYTDAAGHLTYFNGEATMQAKMAFVRDNGFGGAMIWELAYDHYTASNTYDQYSLLPVLGVMMKKPAWLTPAAGSTYDLVNPNFWLNLGTVTFSGDTSASNPGLVVSLDSGTSASVSVPQRWGGLNISGTGKLDLKNSRIILDYSSSSPLGSWNGTNYSGILGLIKSGRNGGSWTGSGMLTSMSAAKSPSFLTTIGAAEASSALGISGSQTKVWNGQTVDATTVLIKYTYAGDANLDGIINGDDYFKIDSGYGAHASGFGAGDFNYDGKINGDDYFLIDANYNKAAVALAAPAGQTAASVAIFRGGDAIAAGVSSDTPQRKLIDELL